MTIKFSRAQRRADRARLKVKRQFHWGYGHKDGWGRTAKVEGDICYMAPREAGLVVNTPTPCSCWMCGNPRRGGAWTNNFGPGTLQEYKALESYKDQVEDLYYTDEDYNNDVYVWDIDYHYGGYSYLEEWYQLKAEKAMKKILFNDVGVWYEQEIKKSRGS